MASRILEILISAKDQATATLGKVEQGLTGFKGAATRMANEVRAGLNSMVGRFLTVGAIAGVLKSASDAANELSASIRKLEGTAKIAGVPLQTLQEIASQGREAFGLSAVTANDLTVAVSKLATKAGDLGMSSDLMERFLDLGAAKGLSATDTLRAVEQSILGIDEGTDKLFGKNPSVLYQEFAASIGKSAGKLTDQEKAMAIATAAMNDGGKVVGAYRDYLQSAAGQQDQARQKMQEASATLGTALTPAFSFAAEMVQWFAKKLQNGIGHVQMFAVQAASLSMAVPAAMKLAAGSVVAFLGDMFDKLRDLPLIGDTFGAVADRLKATGAHMVQENRQALTNIRETYEEQQASIFGSEARSGEKRVKQLQGFMGALNDTTTDSGNQRTKAQEATQKEIERLERESAVRQIQVNEGLTDKQAEETYRRRELLLGATREQRDKLIALWKQMDEANLLLAAGFDKKVVPAVKQTTVEFAALKPPVDNLKTALEAARTAAANAGDTGVSKSKSFGDKLRELGEEAKSVVKKIALIGEVLKGMLADGKISLGEFADAVIDMAKKSGNPLISAVGTAAGLIKDLGGMLFGESPEEKARKQLVKDNTAALKALTKATGDLLKVNATGSEITKAKDFLGSLFGPQGQYTKGSYTAAKLKTGMTDAQLEKLAGELGITLRNKESGAIESKALYQLLQALTALDAGFAQTYAGQRERISQEMSVGVLGKEQQFGALKDVLTSSVGSSALAKALQAGDISTAAGRAALTTALQGTFRQFSSNQLSASDLGGLTGTEFLNAIEELLGLIQDRAESDQEKADLAVKKTEADAAKAEADKKKAEEDAAKADAEKKQAEEDAKKKAADDAKANAPKALVIGGDKLQGSLDEVLGLLLRADKLTGTDQAAIKEPLKDALDYLGDLLDAIGVQVKDGAALPGEVAGSLAESLPLVLRQLIESNTLRDLGLGLSSGLVNDLSELMTRLGAAPTESAPGSGTTTTVSTLVSTTANLMAPLEAQVTLLTSIESGVTLIAKGMLAGAGLRAVDVSANAMASAADASLKYLDLIAANTGGLLTKWTDIDTGRQAALPTALTVTLGDMTVTTAATDAAGTGEAVQAAVTAAINQALADAYLDRQLATGNVTRTVS